MQENFQASSFSDAAPELCARFSPDSSKQHILNIFN